MRVHEDLVTRARVRLLLSDHWILTGEDALWVYRTLFAVSPRVYAHKLVHTLLDASRSPLVADLPAARLALLEEAAAATAWMDNDRDPYAPMVVDAVFHGLAALREQQNICARQ
ncbi:hypothetical protein ACGF13_25890 [Kitasatospora sp. NPDC048286]|uniref:hypothetical protein n=1 Tax=Kitasatospora sp. NPDC048286 TaxID=3364047 RepID=UPI00371D6DE0